MWFIASILLLCVVNVAIGFSFGRWYLREFGSPLTAILNAHRVEDGSLPGSGEYAYPPPQEPDFMTGRTASLPRSDPNATVNVYLENLRESAARLVQIRENGLRFILNDMAARTMSESKRIFDLLSTCVDESETETPASTSGLRVDADEMYQQLSQLESTANNLQLATTKDKADDEQELLTLLMAEIERLQRAMSSWEASMERLTK